MYVDTFDLSQRVTRLRALGDDESVAEAARIEREAEKARDKSSTTSSRKSSRKSSSKSGSKKSK